MSDNSKPLPELSIVIPVYRERDLINPLIADLRRLDPGDLCEIIVVDGHEDGDTIRCIEDPGVKCIAGGRGRAVQMNAGAKAATGGVVLFLHADTRLPRDAVDRIIETMRDDSLVGGAFSFRFESDKTVLRLVGWLATRRARITRVPFGDHGIFVRRDYFVRSGGYADIPIMEDVELMTRIRRSGRRIRILPDRVATSPRRLESEGYGFCAIRNTMLVLLYAIGVPPRYLKRFYPDQPEIARERRQSRRARVTEFES